MKMTKKARNEILNNIKAFNMKHDEMQAIKDTLYIIYNIEKDDNAKMTIEDLTFLQENL